MHSKVAFKCTMLKIVTTVKLEMFVGAFVYESSLLLSKCSCSPRSALWGAGLVPKSSCVPCPHRVPRLAGMRDTVRRPSSLVPPSSSRGTRGHSQTCLPRSPLLLHQPGGKSFCCRAKALASQPPMGVLRWECIYLLGLVLFLWKKCSGRELYPVSQQDGRPMPGAAGAGGPGRAAQGHRSPTEGTLAK